MNDDNDYDPDDNLDIDITPRPSADGHRAYNEDYDPLSPKRGSYHAITRGMSSPTRPS